MSASFRVGLVGARGYVGSELIHLITAHPDLRLGFVSSREREGQAVADFEVGVDPALRYVNFDPAQVATADFDALVLALPNSILPPFTKYP